MKMTSEKTGRKEKNQNIQVFVRLRPLNQRERDIKSLGVVEVVNNREVVVRQSQQSALTKRFTFDKAFPPHSKQVEVYQEVVSPLIEEVLAGYNCTVFAYGQTGTGKTHTMVGEAANNETTWQTDPLAGIIPRALSQLFDELRLSNTEYTVRVSYLELYNEELVDLLSSEDGSKLRIYEDVTRKGANIVNGLEEITVCNKNEVYKIMAQGQERKRVASTLMNAQSSNHVIDNIKMSPRSHTVFTIVVHMKENSPEGEELVKIGKLNLVDLAGSENISKAGSDNPAKRERARECVNINQSLLTLGRVITALVERHPHIPYRESKLTRILQESLGGRTKTSIIATISPGHKDLEETMSTLEYANRAKNIQNKPEVNQKMTKKAILKDYAEEIDRLKRDLYAAREKNGVYLANETFTEMTLKQEEQRKEIQELLLKKRAMEEERERVRGVFDELRRQLEDKLRDTQGALADTTRTLRNTEQHYVEQRELAGARAATERTLTAQAQSLLAAADRAAADAAGLHDAVERRRSVESANRETTRRYREVSAQHRRNVGDRAGNFVASLERTVHDVANALESFTNASSKTHCDSKQILDELVNYTTNVMNKIIALKDKLSADIESTADEELSQFKRDIEARVKAVTMVLMPFSTRVATSLHRAGVEDLGTSLRAVIEELRQCACVQSSRLLSCSSRLAERSQEAGQSARRATAEKRHDLQRYHQRLTDDVRERIAVMMNDKETTENYISEQLASVEREKEETKSRLNKWADEERKILEERIQRHIDSEWSFLQSRINIKLQDIQHQRTVFETRTAQSVEWLNGLLQSSERENTKAEQVLQEFDKELQVYLSDVGVFVEELGKESTALTGDTDRLTADAVKVVEKVKADLQDTLKESERCVQSISENNRGLEQVVERSNKMVTSITQNCNGAMESAVVEFNSASESTAVALRQLDALVAALESRTRDHYIAQGAALAGLREGGHRLQDSLGRELAALEELEERCLQEEYAVYRPTGATPARREYRYPRALAATSPESRVLARLRAADRDLVTEEPEPRSGDSSGSEDSCVFLEPSPPPPAVAPGIVKCTSETDIYLRRRQHEQGKENANRSMSFKRPSKLPAPASHKKPLVDRNAADN